MQAPHSESSRPATTRDEELGLLLDERRSSSVHGDMQPSGISGSVAETTVLDFESFFETERRRLFRALYLMSGSIHEAEELTQDAFLKLWERWDRVSAMTDPDGYLYRTAMNLFRSRARRVLRAAKTSFLFEGSTEPYSAADARDAVVRAVALLTPRQRQALVLTDLLDTDTDEAAILMRVSPSTVRSLVSEAHKRLRTTMEASDGS
jgi:RNA polymerase sigma-70 factor (ECF subfamily)